MPTETRHCVTIGAALAALIALSGCTTASLEDAAPRSASASPAAAPVFSTPGTYPNLNVTPQPATDQISAEKKASDTAELRARRAQASASAAVPVPDRSAELRRIAQSHGDAALAAIEDE